PIAERHGLDMLQFAAAWNLSQSPVKSTVPTFIQESGEGKMAIEDQIRAFAALPEDAVLSPEEVEAVRAIGDNTGCMTLKGASKRHEVSERPDEWPMRDELLDMAGRLGLPLTW
ncbi:MAG: aldo/keto reductase, partial [Verrucomicrobiales bacterium]